jgi:hypothetical protein
MSLDYGAELKLLRRGNLGKHLVKHERTMKIISIISGSKTIITSLVMLVFVIGFSIGYQVCLYYTVGHSALFGNTSLTNSVIEYNATFKDNDDEK